MTFTKAQIEELEKLSKPLMEWLRKNGHPHVTAIVTASGTEVLEGLALVRPKK